MDERLILALDVEPETARAQVQKLKGSLEIFKIGGRLFTALGPSIVTFVHKQKRKVFLDLKFHDIPVTVAESCRNAVGLGVWGLTIHTCGGFDMMQQAARAVAQEARRLGVQKPLIFGVTVLTSMSGSDLAQVGVARSPLAQVKKLAKLAQKAGLDGVVASPNEISAIRKECGKKLLILTPGIRSAAEKGSDDQKRVMSAGEAIRSGSNYLVVGRPILKAPDRAAATRAFLEEIQNARK